MIRVMLKIDCDVLHVLRIMFRFYKICTTFLHLKIEWILTIVTHPKIFSITYTFSLKLITSISNSSSTNDQYSCYDRDYLDMGSLYISLIF